MINKAHRHIHCTRGYTLIELMLAVVISSLVMAAAFSIFKKQQDHYTAQLDVTIMQQNIRAAMAHLSRDIRLAGYGDPGMEAAKIINAEPNLIYFTADLTEDGSVDDSGEHIAYDLYEVNGVPTLSRVTSANPITVNNVGPSNWAVANPAHNPAAEYIEHLHFQYLDKNGNPTVAEDKVQSVVITLVARAEKPDPNFKNNMTYTAPDGTSWTKNDNYRRRIQSMTIECRNAGLD